MATGSSRKLCALFARWIRPLRGWWKPLQWIWGAIVLSIVINDGSSWLITKSFDTSGTPLGWLIGHLEVTLSLLGGLILLTLAAGIASRQVDSSIVQTAQLLTLTPQQRQQFIRSFQQEYGGRLAHSLQGRVAIELGLHERTDMIAASAELVFHHTDTATEYPLPSGTSIIQVYDQAQRGLLILGAPGSGKTTLLLNLVMELLQRAVSDLDHPIPIILNLSSWTEKKLAFPDWLNEQLSLVYGIPNRVRASWITSEQIMFLLDGLDEMEDSVRSMCIKAINKYRREHLVPLVVCSRNDCYLNQDTQLALPMAVEVQPLEPQKVMTYLGQLGRPTVALRAAIRVNSTLKQLLTTPLMLNVAILTYRDKKVKDLPQMGSPEEQQRQIFDRYVERMLKRQTRFGYWTPQQTRHFLCWLAQQMQQHKLIEFYLERLQPSWLATPKQQVFFIFCFRLILVLLFTFCSTLTFLSLSGQILYLALALILGAALGLLMGWRSEKVLEINEFIAKLQETSKRSIDVSQLTKLKQHIRRAGWTGLCIGLLFLLFSELVFGIPTWLSFGSDIQMLNGLFGGLLLGLYTGGGLYLFHCLLRLFLWRNRVIPWCYARFLEEATERVLLQRIGSSYRFIHPLLQEYFASLATFPVAS